METGQKTWRDRLHIPTREEQHRYGVTILPEDFDMQEKNLTRVAFETDLDLCFANPSEEGRWCFLMSQKILYEYYKNEEERANGKD